MKLRIHSWLFVLLWPTATTPLPAKPVRTEAIVAYPAQQAGIRPEHGFISIGSSRENVTSLLGDPEVRVSDEFWVYWDFRVKPEQVNPHGFDALIVRFRAGTVAELKLSDGEIIRRALARKAGRLNR